MGSYEKPKYNYSLRALTDTEKKPISKYVYQRDAHQCRRKFDPISQVDFKLVFLNEVWIYLSITAARSWFDLLYNWPPNSEVLLNNSLLELIYFLILNTAPKACPILIVIYISNSHPRIRVQQLFDCFTLLHFCIYLHGGDRVVSRLNLHFILIFLSLWWR